VCQEQRRTLENRGVTSTTRGFSTLLAKFLTQFVGHGAAHKHVPDVAFCAPEEFVIGILDGYFSGDGTVRATSIHSSSVSYRLTEGITMLCSRIGVFARMSKSQQKSNNMRSLNILPAYHITIRGHFAKRFAEEVS